MARKVKGQLPSGNIRVRVYDYTDENGKKVYRSFTAKSKAEAQAMANEWKVNKRELSSKTTVHQACDNYIALKESVLSPSTIRGYNFAAKKISAYSIYERDISTLTDADIQSFVSALSLAVSPKYIKNIYGFLRAAIALHNPRLSFNPTMPQKTKQSLYIPTSEDVQKLIDACSTTELKLAVLFAAVGTMRRGEACAVTFDDINYSDHIIAVNKAFVETPVYTWELKAPKTYDSMRNIIMPEYVFDLIRSLKRKDGYILNMTPDRLYVRFKKAVRAAGLPDFRYHDLRHYAASQMHAKGMPDRYIEAIGGWKPGSNVLKRVYENVIDTELVKMRNEYLENNSFKV